MGRSRWLVLTLLIVSCAAPRATGPADQGGAPRAAGPTRITAAMLGEPPAVWDNINPSGGTVPGIGQLEELVTAGLTVEDGAGLRRPQLAEAIPSIENGLWVLHPDGRMELTWKIREGVRWHDGAPFTADDLLFSAAVAQDRDVAVFRAPAFDLIERVEAKDTQTVVVSWKGPYIDADTMFSQGSSALAPPLPKHLLERTFAEERATFLEIPYWTTQFVSTGPFRVREWAPGSHALLDAFDRYLLGRPKIDQIEVKFIPDPSTLIANVLAGAVDLTFRRGVSLEQGIQVRDQWRGGKMVPFNTGWTVIYPQLRTPSPAALGDPRFRRALVHAMDRQELADNLMAGVVPVAHSIIAPDQAEHRHVETSIVRYPYDPQRAVRLIEDLGYARGPDGFFRDPPPAGQRLSVEIRTTTNDANQKSTFAIADYLQRVGVGAEAVVIPVQKLQDREYRATYSGLELVNQPHGVDGLGNLLHGSAAPLPERGYRANSTRNRGAYLNPEYDGLMDRYLSTIPVPERMRLLGQIIYQQTDLQLVIGVFYTADAIMMANGLRNTEAGSNWNAHEWEVH